MRWPIKLFLRQKKSEAPVENELVEKTTLSEEQENDAIVDAVNKLISEPARRNVTRLLQRTVDRLVKRAPTDCGWHVKIYSSVLFENRKQYQVILKATSNTEFGGGILEIGSFFGAPVYKMIFQITATDIEVVRVEWKGIQSNNVYDLLEGFGKAFTIDNIKDLGFERLDPNTMLPLKADEPKPIPVGVVVPLKRQ